MAEKSKIGWTDATQNFWLGCTKIHQGCANCYAEEMIDTRFNRAGWGPEKPRVVTSKSNWQQPFKWDKKSNPESPTVVFTNSLADFFERNLMQVVNHKQEILCMNGHAMVPESQAFDTTNRARLADVRAQAWEIIMETTNLRWVILTKRPADIPAMLPFEYVECERCQGKLQYNAAGDGKPETLKECICTMDRPGFMREIISVPNAFVCISISNQDHYDQLMSEFRPHIERAKPFLGGMGLSIEPMLGPIQLDIEKHSQHAPYPFTWVKVGGESGKNARKFDLAWAESLMLECSQAKETFIPDMCFFYKQNGERCVRTVGGREYPFSNKPGDKKGEHLESIPSTLHVRQSPFKQEVKDPSGVLDSEISD